MPRPAEYSVFHSLLSLTIGAPPATAADPLVLVFEFTDAQMIPSSPDQWPAVAHQLMKVYRNGVEIPDCTGAPGTADPDPCVESRVLTPGGDVILTVLTSAASEWDFTLGSCPVTVDPACITGFGKASLNVQKLVKGPVRRPSENAGRDRRAFPAIGRKRPANRLRGRWRNVSYRPKLGTRRVWSLLR